MNIDENRVLIVQKIEAKASAIEKLRARPKNIATQKEIFQTAIDKKLAEIQTLRDKMAKYDEGTENIAGVEETRTGELEHMGQILERYDSAIEERASLNVIISKKLDEDMWMPGMDEKLKLKNDPEYVAARKRKLFLDDVIDNALPDVRKISVSRGEVSHYHMKDLGKVSK